MHPISIYNVGEKLRK